MSRTLFKSTSVVGATTLLSRLTGLARDVAIAQVLGAGMINDAFLVAYRIPNFLRRLFAEGAFSQSFVPVISEYKVRRSSAEVRQLVGGVSGTLGLVLLALTVPVVIGSPFVIRVYALGFTPGTPRYELASELLRWTFPYLLFIAMTALYAGVLNSYRRFALPAFTQVAQNLILVGAALWFASRSSNPGLVLAIGVFISGCVQLLILLPPVGRLGVLGLPRWRPRMEGVRRIGRLMVPGIIGSSMSQVALVLDTTIATLMGTGSVSWLYYADRLMEFPLGVFSIALGTVILPGLAAHHAEQDNERFSATLDWALRLTVLLVTPAAVGLLCFSGPITAALFFRGRISPHDVQMVSWALMAYSWGLITFSLVKVLAPGYFARQDTRAPVRYGMVSLAVTMTLNIAVALPVSYMGYPAPHILIAFATALGSAVNAFQLWRGLQKSGVYRPSHAWAKLLPRIGAGCLVMGALLWWLGSDMDGWLALGQWSRLARCLGDIVLAALLYFAVLFVFGVRYRDLRTQRPGNAA